MKKTSVLCINLATGNAHKLLDELLSKVSEGWEIIRADSTATHIVYILQLIEEEFKSPADYLNRVG
jgi:hypothetical protein